MRTTLWYLGGNAVPQEIKDFLAKTCRFWTENAFDFVAYDDDQRNYLDYATRGFPFARGHLCIWKSQRYLMTWWDVISRSLGVLPAPDVIDIKAVDLGFIGKSAQSYIGDRPHQGQGDLHRRCLPAEPRQGRSARAGSCGRVGESADL